MLQQRRARSPLFPQSQGLLDNEPQQLGQFSPPREERRMPQPRDSGFSFSKTVVHVDEERKERSNSSERRSPHCPTNKESVECAYNEFRTAVEHKPVQSSVPEENKEAVSIAIESAPAEEEEEKCVEVGLAIPIKD